MRSGVALLGRALVSLDGVLGVLGDAPPRVIQEPERELHLDVVLLRQ